MEENENNDSEEVKALKVKLEAANTKIDSYKTLNLSRYKSVDTEGQEKIKLAKTAADKKQEQIEALLTRMKNHRAENRFRESIVIKNKLFSDYGYVAQ